MKTVQVSNGGYSAGVGAMFFVAIIDHTNRHLLQDAIASVVHEAEGGGSCLLCARATGRPSTFAVLRRSGGYEPPVARPICAVCTAGKDHPVLRRQAMAAFHRGPQVQS